MKRKQQKHGNHRSSKGKEKPTQAKSQQLRVEEIPPDSAPTNIDTALDNITVSSTQQKEYDFDIEAVIKDLQMSYKSDDEESSQRKEAMSEDSSIKEIDTFLSMKNDKVIISRCYSKKKHPQDLQDVQVHTEEFKVKKIGWVGRKHTINYNVDEMGKQGIKRENTIKELKKDLARKNKLVNEASP